MALLQQRIQLLYRPSYAAQLRRQLRSMSSANGVASGSNNNADRDVVLTNFTSSSNASSRDAVNDPPPKYTPPPSYSTATGAR